MDVTKGTAQRLINEAFTQLERIPKDNHSLEAVSLKLDAIGIMLYTISHYIIKD